MEQVSKDVFSNGKNAHENNILSEQQMQLLTFSKYLK